MSQTNDCSAQTADAATLSAYTSRDSTSDAGHPMTDDEASAILKGGDGWIHWNDETHRPYWCGGSITLDGEFSADELRAILHFAPNEPRQPNLNPGDPT